MADLSSQLAAFPRDLGRLRIITEELAFVPELRESRRLAEKIHAGLLEVMADQPVPQAFPLPPDKVRCYQEAELVWQALACLRLRWMFAVEKRPDASLAFGVLSCLREIVVLRGMVHQPLPDGFWLDTHQLYHQLRDLGLEHKRVRWPFLRHHTRSTPEREYVRILVMGLASLPGLLPQEVQALDSLVEKWVPLTRIGGGTGEVWWIDPQVDAPARRNPPGKGLGLDLKRLTDFVDGHRALAAPTGRFEYWDRSHHVVAAELLRFWVRSWSGVGEVPDHPVCMEAEMEVGLTEIFQRLQGEAGYAGRVIPGEGFLEVQGGAVQVGDLVGLFAPGSCELLALTVVSWLSWPQPQSGRLQVRLKKLSERALPVGVQPLHPGSGTEICQRGLLIPAAEQSFLLLSSQPLSAGVIVRLLHGGKVYPVQLERRENIARGVLRFVWQSAAGRFQK